MVFYIPQYVRLYIRWGYTSNGHVIIKSVIIKVTKIIQVPMMASLGH